MPFLLLLVLTLTCVQREWPAPPEWIGRSGSVWLSWCAMALFGLAAWVAGIFWDRRLQREPTARTRLVRRYHTFRRWHAYGILFSFFLLVCFGGWGWFVGEHCVTDNIVTPGTDFILLSPLFAGLMLSWAGYHPLEKSLALTGFMPLPEAFPGRWSYVALQTRHSFILTAPPLVLMFLQQVILALWPSLERNQLVFPLIGLGLLGTMYAFVPWLLRILLGLRPLPAGPLRDRLMATARRLSFRFNDILVWNTRHTIVNAMVAGPLPILRYVILTDRLAEELQPEEIEAVFGHEVGHIKHHHLLFYFGFLLASLMAVIGLWTFLTENIYYGYLENWLVENVPEVNGWLNQYQILTMLPLLAMLGLYIVFVFGFLSRRCERQADIYGCRTVSVPVFVSALEKVARLNGISRDKPGWLQSWQHSTIALRVAFLEQMHADPAVEPRFQRRVGLVKWAMLASLFAILAVLAAIEPGNVWAVIGKLGN